MWSSIQAVDVEAVAVTVKELVSYALTLNPNNQSWLITQADIYFGEDERTVCPTVKIQLLRYVDKNFGIGTNISVFPWQKVVYMNRVSFNCLRNLNGQIRTSQVQIICAAYAFTVA